MGELPNRFKEPLLSVSEFIELLNDVIGKYKFNIQGEISSFTNRGNTVFFTLTDAKNDASISCLIWKSRFSALGIELEEGMEVKIFGSANIYVRTGKFTFVADNIIPVGEGALRKAFEKLKEQLQKQGYFDIESKKPIPQYVKTVGLITADKSDAKKDFETHLGNFGYKILFHDVRVEGNQSIDSIINAIRTLNEFPEKIDVLVLTRGGGSLENLQAFNSEGVARAIAASKIPVISAIGHENDVTIADLVADARASTPTHAGKILAEPWIELSTTIKQLETALVREFKRILKTTCDNLQTIETELTNQFERQLNSIKISVNNLASSQIMSFKHVLNTFKTLEKDYMQNIYAFNFAKHSFQKDLQNLSAITSVSIGTWYKEINKKLENHSNLLKVSDPKLKLKQGYSISRNSNGKILKNAKSVKQGDILNTELANGKIISKVQN
ncbi:MAG: exodeoxyribonuclease VII large subunit [Patescibacteria group bacterium]